MPDLIADVDAKNIANSFNSEYRLSVVLKTYYTYYTNHRFTSFIENLGGYEELYSKAYDYTRGNGAVKHMILHHFAKKVGSKEVSTKESDALYNGFISVIGDELREENR